MGQKHESKYLSKEKVSRKNKNTAKVILVLVLAVVLIAALAAVVILQRGENLGNENAGNMTQATVEATQDPSNTDEAATDPVLQFQLEGMDGIYYREVRENGVIMEVFCMMLGNEERELFRICFGDAAMGTIIGRMQVEGREVPVSVVTSSYSQDDFPDEETYSQYYSAMEYLNVVLAEVYANETFVASDGQNTATTQTPMETQMVELLFWSVELPVNIEWEEKTGNQWYSADFYGILGGERILLYTVSLGDKDVSNAIGMYEIDGGKTPVSVKTYSLDSQSTWLGDAYSAEHAAMMETVNDLIQVIAADEKFSEDMP